MLDQHRARRVQDLERAAAQGVVALDPQQDVARGAGGEQDVAGAEEGGVVGDEVIGAVGHQLEAHAHVAGPPAQVADEDGGPVGQLDLVPQRGAGRLAGVERLAVEGGFGRPQGGDLGGQAEAHLQRALLRFAPLDRDLAAAEAQEDRGGREVLAGVEVERQVLVGEHHLGKHDLVALVEPAELVGCHPAAPRHDGLVAHVLEEDQVLEPECRQTQRGRDRFEADVGIEAGTDDQRFEPRTHAVGRGRRRPAAGIELVHDVDGLACHAEGRHEPVEGGQGLGADTGPRDEHVELHPEQDLFLHGQAHGQPGCHGLEILALGQRLGVEAAEFAVNRFRVVVAQEAERRVDLVLVHHAIHPGEAREHAHQVGQVRLEDRLRGGLEPTPQPPQAHPPPGTPQVPEKAAAAARGSLGGGGLRTGRGHRMH